MANEDRESLMTSKRYLERKKQYGGLSKKLRKRLDTVNRRLGEIDREKQSFTKNQERQYEREAKEDLERPFKERVKKNVGKLVSPFYEMDEQEFIRKRVQQKKEKAAFEQGRAEEAVKMAKKKGRERARSGGMIKRTLGGLSGVVSSTASELGAVSTNVFGAGARSKRGRRRRTNEYDLDFGGGPSLDFSGVFGYDEPRPRKKKKKQRLAQDNDIMQYI